MGTYPEIIFWKSFPVLPLPGSKHVIASEITRNSLVWFTGIATVVEVQGFKP
jgi:hypothetical protein